MFPCRICSPSPKVLLGRPPTRERDRKKKQNWLCLLVFLIAQKLKQHSCTKVGRICLMLSFFKIWIHSLKAKNKNKPKKTQKTMRWHLTKTFFPPVFTSRLNVHCFFSFAYFSDFIKRKRETYDLLWIVLNIIVLQTLSIWLQDTLQTTFHLVS